MQRDNKLLPHDSFDRDSSRALQHIQSRMPSFQKLLTSARIALHRSSPKPCGESAHCSRRVVFLLNRILSPVSSSSSASSSSSPSTHDMADCATLSRRRSSRSCPLPGENASMSSRAHWSHPTVAGQNESLACASWSTAVSRPFAWRSQCSTSPTPAASICNISPFHAPGFPSVSLSVRGSRN